jgi:ketosteroid isomerase-like protein
LTACRAAKTIGAVDQKGDQMAHPNENAMREAMNAFWQKAWAADIRYHIPGRSPVAGDYEGTAQVLELFTRISDLSGGTFRVELHDAVANDEHSVALFTARAERAGKQLEDNAVLTAHIHDGNVTEVWVQATDLYAFDEFWS